MTRKIIGCEFGTMEIVKNSSHRMTAYLSDLKEGPLSISGFSVRSLSKNNLKKVADELKKPTCIRSSSTEGVSALQVLLRWRVSNDIEKQRQKQKYFEITNVRYVLRKGVYALMLKLSSENLESKGAYAKTATHLDDSNNGDYKDASILCWLVPLNDGIDDDLCDRFGWCIPVR
jgi:hypothetical protein